MAYAKKQCAWCREWKSDTREYFPLKSGSTSKTRKVCHTCLGSAWEWVEATESAKDDHKPRPNFPIELPRTHLKSGYAAVVEKGFVYLAWLLNTNFYKIGCSAEPQKRVRAVTIPPEIYPGHRKKRLIHRIETNHMHEAEYRMHQHFADKRIVDEWFRLDNADLAYIQSISYIDIEGLEETPP